MRKRPQPPDFPTTSLIPAPQDHVPLPEIAQVCVIGAYVCGVTLDHHILQLAKLVSPRGRRAHRKSPEPKGARPESGDGLGPSPGTRDTGVAE